jgi:AcrR family transcriptional regulator
MNYPIGWSIRYDRCMATLRRDAVRNRERILVAARELSAEGETLQLNTVAHRAEVGVGTVYRHFASPEALAETLVEHRFIELIDLARQLAEEREPAAALQRFLAEALRAYTDDPSFAAATVNPSSARVETTALRAELIAGVVKLVSRAASRLRDDLDGRDIMILLCGLGYSARLRPINAATYLDTLMVGILR